MLNLINYAYADEVSVGVNTGAWHAITSANFVVQIVLFVLMMMSVVSWAIIISKRKQFRAVRDADHP